MNIKYTKDHDWISLEGDVAVFGITDFAQDALGDVVFLELPKVGEEVVSGDAVGVIESIKSVVDLAVPFSGSVVSVNEDAVNNPSVCNTAAMTTWLFKTKVSDLSFWNDLMNDSEYQKFCNK